MPPRGFSWKQMTRPKGDVPVGLNHRKQRLAGIKLLQSCTDWNIKTVCCSSSQHLCLHQEPACESTYKCIHRIQIMWEDRCYHSNRIFMVLRQLVSIALAKVNYYMSFLYSILCISFGIKEGPHNSICIYTAILSCLLNVIQTNRFQQQPQFLLRNWKVEK